MPRFACLALVLALPATAWAQPVHPEVPDIEIPEIEIPEIAVPEIPAIPEIVRPAPAPGADGSEASDPEEGPQSRFTPLALPASRFEPERGTSNFGEAPAASSFGVVEIAPELRETTEGILSEFGAVQRDDSLLITLPGDVLFDFDRHDIRADARPVLDRLAEALSAMEGASIHILGHTDSRGSDDYNQGLSERRANAVRAWLASHGIAEAAMTTEGRGESEPVAPNSHDDGSDNPEGRQLNRRVEFVVSTQ